VIRKTDFSNTDFGTKLEKSVTAEAIQEALVPIKYALAT